MCLIRIFSYREALGKVLVAFFCIFLKIILMSFLLNIEQDYCKRKIL